MRTVASYSLSASVPSNSDSAAVLDEIENVVSAWIASKGTVDNSKSSQSIIFTDGREGEYVQSKFESSIGHIIQHRLLEPTPTGMFQTFVALGRHNEMVAIFIELRAGGPSYQLGPVQLDVRCPNLVRHLLETELDWYVGDTLVTTNALGFKGAEGGYRLAEIIAHESRNLPVVVISEHEGYTLSANFPNNLARDLSGLALVCELDTEAAWTLTERFGREWSCFNGAIRLYWPTLRTLRDPFQHPLWTRQALLRRVTDIKDASYTMRKTLRSRILGLSAFAVREPEFFRGIRSQARREELEQVKSQMQEEGDWRKLADLYSKENDQLQEDIALKDEEINDLKVQLTNVQSALGWQSSEEEGPDPEPEMPPATVKDAVDRAKERLSDTLVFGDSVEDSLNGVAADAGPPDKILQYLEQLSKLSMELRNGSLGTTTIDWLHKRGINASTESETILNSEKEMSLRRWDDGVEEREFRLHLKPSNATAPDRCVRIYFDTDQEQGVVRIGWIGRHP